MAGRILPFEGMTPRIDATAFVAQSADVIGDVGVWWESEPLIRA